MVDREKASANKLLLSELGRYPPHLAPLPGFDRTVRQVCRLLWGRFPSDVRRILVLLNTRTEKLAEGEQLVDGGSAPGFNYELYGTALWSVIQSFDEQYLKRISVSRWEFVAVIAWDSLRHAISVLNSEPRGLSLYQPSEKSLRAFDNARFWLECAQRESLAKQIQTGKKIHLASRKGNESVHKSDAAAYRREIILREANDLRSVNSLLSNFDIAKKISKRHNGETGFGVRTIQSVLKA